MDFNNEAICPCRNRSLCHWSYQVPFTHPVAWIDYYREVGELLQYRGRAYIHGIPGCRLESPYPSFTKDYFSISFGSDIFGRHEEIKDSCRQPSLQYYRNTG